jgi:Glycosyl hydrolases family 31
MSQQEFVPKRYKLEPLEDHHPTFVRIRSQDSPEVSYSFEAVKPGIFKTTFSSPSHPLPPFPIAHAPQADPSAFRIHNEATSRTFHSPEDAVQATLSWADGPPLVTLGFKDAAPLRSDLPFRSYVFDGPGAAHYSRHYRNSLYVGLGERRHHWISRIGILRFLPLIVSVTMYFVRIPCTSHAQGYYCIESEMDGVWGFFNIYRRDHGGLEEFFLIGRSLQDVVRLYADLVGYPLLVPRWAFRYLAGDMKYSMLDEPRASDALMEFTNKIQKHDIPCSSFQLSSGYTVSENEPKTRNVFTWNRHRFPDPKGFCDALHRQGIRLIANIKPYVLALHPRYKELAEPGALFTDPRTKQTDVARLWSAGGGESGKGGHIDFSYNTGYDFWYNGVKELRKIGMDCMWNDNNEYVIAFDNWQLAHRSFCYRRGY